MVVLVVAVVVVSVVVVVVVLRTRVEVEVSDHVVFKHTKGSNCDRVNIMLIRWVTPLAAAIGIADSQWYCLF